MENQIQRPFDLLVHTMITEIVGEDDYEQFVALVLNANRYWGDESAETRIEYLLYNSRYLKEHIDTVFSWYGRTVNLLMNLGYNAIPQNLLTITIQDIALKEIDFAFLLDTYIRSILKKQKILTLSLCQQLKDGDITTKPEFTSDKEIRELIIPQSVNVQCLKGEYILPNIAVY